MLSSVTGSHDASRLRRSPCSLLASVVLTAAPPKPRSGLDLPGLDTLLRPQDDLFRFANGSWLKTASIPPDRVAYGTFIADGRSDRGAPSATSSTRRHESRIVLDRRFSSSPISTRSYLDDATLEALGTKPIEAELARIAALKTKSEFATEAGHLGATLAGGMFGTMLSVDGDDPRG